MPKITPATSSTTTNTSTSRRSSPIKAPNNPAAIPSRRILSRPLLFTILTLTLIPSLTYFGATLKSEHQVSAAKEARRAASPAEKIEMLEQRRNKLKGMREGLVKKVEELEKRSIAKEKRKVEVEGIK